MSFIANNEFAKPRISIAVTLTRDKNARRNSRNRWIKSWNVSSKRFLFFNRKPVNHLVEEVCANVLSDHFLQIRSPREGELAFSRWARDISLAPANRSRSSGKIYYPKLDIRHTGQRFIAQIEQTRLNYLPIEYERSERNTYGSRSSCALALFAHVKYVFIKIYRV